MKLLCIESPFRSDDRSVEVQNVRFARHVCRFAVKRGYAPFASHLLYTQSGILQDSISEERSLGIHAGLAWATHAEEVWFCLRPDGEFSQGMLVALDRHVARGATCRLLRFTQEGHFVREEPLYPTVREVAEYMPNPEGFLEFFSRTIPEKLLLDHILGHTLSQFLED